MNSCGYGSIVTIIKPICERNCNMAVIAWNSSKTITSKAYKCPYCDNKIASNVGFEGGGANRIYLCPHCSKPTYYDGGKDKFTPGISFGEYVSDLPEDINSIYTEARSCMTVSAHTAAVMLCRKILMNISVQKGAEPNQSFVNYVNYLGEHGFVPPGGEGWIDHIRTKGNQANHEIEQMTRKDAEELIIFTGMLLKFIYELPAKMPNDSEK